MKDGTYLYIVVITAMVLITLARSANEGRDILMYSNDDAGIIMLLWPGQLMKDGTYLCIVVITAMVLITLARSANEGRDILIYSSNNSHGLNHFGPVS